MTITSELVSRNFLGQLHAAVNRHDADAVAALCAEGVLWDDPAAAEPLQGRNAVRRFHCDMMFKALPDVHVELIDGPYFAQDASQIAVRLRIQGTMNGPLVPPGFAPTGGRIDFESAEFSKIEDGLLVRHRVILDMLGLARQIGAVPAAGSFAERANVWFQHVVAWRSRQLHAAGSK